MLLIAALFTGIGCRNTRRGAASLPSASPGSVALPESGTAADAPHAPAVIESASSRVTTYSDPDTGVSFRYPSTWRPWHSGSVMYPPGLSQAAGPARITQVFDPQLSAWAKTNLVGLSFSYAVKTGVSAEACTQLGTGSTAGSKAATAEMINGIAFGRVEGSDAGMCHQRSSMVDTALRGSRCFVFERDLDTVCPEVRGLSNPVALTAAQTSALRAELDGVMASVRLR